jgi:YVTN family beta-propeller protein
MRCKVRGLLRILWLPFVAAGAVAAGCGGGGSGGSNTGGGGSTGSGGHGGAAAVHSGTTVSTSILLTADDRELWVVNPDADSVSVIDPDARVLLAEIPLGAAAPAVDPQTKRFDPAVSPRALALVDGKKLYVAGQSANRVFVIDVATRAVTKSIAVPAAPTGLAAAPDGSAVYVVSHEAGVLSRIDPASDALAGSVALTEHPWGVTVSADGASLFVTHLLMDAGVSVVDAHALSIRSKTLLADEPRGGDKRLPNGVARGLYQATPRPSTGELWVPHLLLGIKTPQPELDFESTVFPTVSALAADGATPARRLVFQPPVAGAKGSFSDSCSGPRAVAFTPDGKLALLALSASEDVMVFDAESGNEISLVRPLPSTLLEGIVIDHAGARAFVDGRGSHDVTVLRLDASDTIVPAAVDGAPIDRLTSDPMPAQLRLGQRLFNTANSAAFPITKNFWVACASCHIEGGSDAVTWLFAQGPRDTPSNAGGPINTGFILRQAVRTNIQQYDETIRVEQGGDYHADQPAQQADLDALAAYVNYAIPFPQNPFLALGGTLTDAQKRGETTFNKQCAVCHGGPFYTDSAEGNPSLDLSKPVVLHDIGTCVTTGAYPDKPAVDVAGNAHTACDFDTPTLRGIFATPPYLHDGSARTLRDVVDRLSFSSGLADGDKDDLVAFLQTL